MGMSQTQLGYRTIKELLLPCISLSTPEMMPVRAMLVLSKRKRRPVSSSKVASLLKTRPEGRSRAQKHHAMKQSCERNDVDFPGDVRHHAAPGARSRQASFGKLGCEIDDDLFAGGLMRRMLSISTQPLIRLKLRATGHRRWGRDKWPRQESQIATHCMT